MHSGLIDPDTNHPYRFKKENRKLRNSILYVRYAPEAEDLFDLWDVVPRRIPDSQVPFERAWAEYREGKTFEG
jgi:hypothetical protein